MSRTSPNITDLKLSGEYQIWESSTDAHDDNLAEEHEEVDDSGEHRESGHVPQQ